MVSGKNTMLYCVWICATSSITSAWQQTKINYLTDKNGSKLRGMSASCN